MSGNTVTLEEAVALTLQLSLLDKIRLLERLVSVIERDLMTLRPVPRRSLYGLCADLGPAPSAEEIDQARYEAWSNFPL